MTAVLDVSTFSKFKKKDPLNLKFKKKLKSAFKTIQEKGYKNLVIDLRSNGGGSIHNSGRLLSYLLTEPFSVMRQSTIKPKAVLTYITMDLNPVFPLVFLLNYRWDKESRLWLSRTKKKKDFKLDKKYPFKGHVYFLSNGASYSATVSVLAHAKNQEVGDRGRNARRCVLGRFCRSIQGHQTTQLQNPHSNSFKNLVSRRSPLGYF